MHGMCIIIIYYNVFVTNIVLAQRTFKTGNRRLLVQASNCCS